MYAIIHFSSEEWSGLLSKNKQWQISSTIYFCDVSDDEADKLINNAISKSNLSYHKRRNEIF